jgi:hypothetical protein
VFFLCRRGRSTSVDERCRPEEAWQPQRARAPARPARLAAQGDSLAGSQASSAPETLVEALRPEAGRDARAGADLSADAYRDQAGVPYLPAPCESREIARLDHHAPHSLRARRDVRQGRRISVRRGGAPQCGYPFVRVAQLPPARDTRLAPVAQLRPLRPLPAPMRKRQKGRPRPYQLRSRRGPRRLLGAACHGQRATPHKPRRCGRAAWSNPRCP